MITNDRRAGKLEIGIVLALLASVLAISLYHLQTFPAPWFDEGWYLQVPKNLVLYGQYATLSAEGFRLDDTVLAVAPTIYLPIALAFRAAGIGWLQARLIMVIYLLGAAVAYYVVARSAYGPMVAVAALYLFLFKLEDDPFTSTLYLGRQVMGEVPALAFLLLGSLLWSMAIARKRNILCVLSGILLGLAMITKLQFVIWIPPALLGAAILTHLRGERVWASVILTVAVSVGCLVLWFGCLWVILGPTNLASMVRDLGMASSPQVRVLSLTALASGLKFLFRSDFLLFGVPGLVYVAFLVFRRNRTPALLLLLLAFVLVGMIWFVLGSVGWPRYAYPFLAIAHIFTAKLFNDLGGGLRKPLSGGLRFGPRQVAVLLMLLVLPLSSLRAIAKELVARPDYSLPEFQRVLQAQVPHSAVIETWEWEVTLLDSEHRYHLPPTPLLNKMIAHVYLAVPYDAREYDFRQAQPGYVVVGRFARWTGVYPEAFLKEHCRLVSRVGEYELFEVIN